MSDAVRIEPLTLHMGAGIHGIDLTRPIGAKAAAAMRDALTAHHVLFFRDQPIDFEPHDGLPKDEGAALLAFLVNHVQRPEYQCRFRWCAWATARFDSQPSRSFTMSAHSQRRPGHAIDPLFTDRWSPRAFDGSEIAEEALMPLFEAARWAPSAFNVQPWRFIYALRATPEWDRLLATLIPFNQGWAGAASALVYIVSDRFTRDAEGAPKGESHSHSFDAGAAWAQLALQAVRSGLFAHGMTGFDHEAARAALALPEEFRIEAAVAIGRIGDPATLAEGLRPRETPSDRKPLSALVFQGQFGG